MPDVTYVMTNTSSVARKPHPVQDESDDTSESVEKVSSTPRKPKPKKSWSSRMMMWSCTYRILSTPSHYIHPLASSVTRKKSKSNSSTPRHSPKFTGTNSITPASIEKKTITTPSSIEKKTITSKVLECLPKRLKKESIETYVCRAYIDQLYKVELDVSNMA